MYSRAGNFITTPLLLGAVIFTLSCGLDKPGVGALDETLCPHQCQPVGECLSGGGRLVGVIVEEGVSICAKGEVCCFLPGAESKGASPVFENTEEDKEQIVVGPGLQQVSDAANSEEGGETDAGSLGSGGEQTSEGDKESDNSPPQFECAPPDHKTCGSMTEILYCDPDGKIQWIPCPENHSCQKGECLPHVCTPSTTECVTANSFRDCSADGMMWSEPTECPPQPYGDPFCDFETNTCLCAMPLNVLFLLDASGSMQLQEVSPGITQWDVALDAISSIMDEYTFLKYGLATFPNDTVDCGQDICHGNGGCDQVGGLNLEIAQNQVNELNLYLDNRQLAVDPSELSYVLTPLLATFDSLLTDYPEDGLLKSHEMPTYIVLLSDGEDSCYNPMDPMAPVGYLGNRARKLRDLYGVKTFVIGFNLQSGGDQLNAIIMNGGTGHSEFIAATDLSSLSEAFGLVFSDMDPRNCKPPNEVMLAPDCVDEDQDGWCASLDCQDDNPQSFPGKPEIAGNGADDDCDGLVDELPDNQVDDDGDGFSEVEGDCNDFQALVGPGAMDIAEDGMDNDCDGETDEFECDCTELTGTSLNALACAAELGCSSALISNTNMHSPTNDNLSGAYQAVSHFGHANNHLQAKKGTSYTLLSTGYAQSSDRSRPLSGGWEFTDPYSPSENMNDASEFRVELTAPMNAQGFAIDYVFFSAEYDEYVGDIYNDRFYIVLKAPQTTGGTSKVINFTDCRKPWSYYDLSGADCPLASGFCCFVAINTSLSECCWYDGCPDGKWTTNIAGTGFSCANSYGVDSSSKGSSTGWLTTTWPINPGETFELTFHIHDTEDKYYDSEVLLDNFRWSSKAVTPGTEPVQ